ncbi:MAG: hypothetical protein QG620_128 [Patescibacteria group bacterium]|nr:hypothetical protein [Patescibacteria group bacterium]
MDILAHSLWAGAAGKAVNIKKKKPLKVWVMAFFGFFPDLFAFAPAFAYMFASYIFPGIPKMYHPGPNNIEPATRDTLLISNLTHNLYNLSHSLIIFFLIFGLVWLIFKRPIWELGGWLVHILMDIPSHSYDFYPTPFLWPVSNFMINGTHWGTPWFIIVNYSLLIAVYFIFWIIKRKSLSHKP